MSQASVIEDAILGTIEFDIPDTVEGLFPGVARIALLEKRRWKGYRAVSSEVTAWMPRLLGHGEELCLGDFRFLISRKATVCAHCVYTADRIWGYTGFGAERVRVGEWVTLADVRLVGWWGFCPPVIDLKEAQ